MTMNKEVGQKPPNWENTYSEVPDSFTAKGSNLRRVIPGVKSLKIQPITIAFDCTESMINTVLRLIDRLKMFNDFVQDNLFKFCPAINLSYIGDAKYGSSDRSFFISPTFYNRDLKDYLLKDLIVPNLYGGRDEAESYELFAYYLSRFFTIRDPYYQNKKGIAFIVGDDIARDVDLCEVEKVFGHKDLGRTLTCKEIFTEASKSWDIYYLLVGGSQHYGSEKVKSFWENVLPGRVLELKDPDIAIEMMASLVTKHETGQLALPNSQAAKALLALGFEGKKLLAANKVAGLLPSS